MSDNDEKLAYLLGEYDIETTIWVRDFPSPFLFVTDKYAVLYDRVPDMAPFWLDSSYKLTKFEAMVIKETK